MRILRIECFGEGGALVPINIDLYNTQMFLDWLKTKLYLDSIAANAKMNRKKRRSL